MVSAFRHLIGNAGCSRAAGSEGRLGVWEPGTVLEWLVTAGDPWIPSLERNTTEGRSSKATGCPGLQPPSSMQE